MRSSRSAAAVATAFFVLGGIAVAGPSSPTITPTGPLPVHVLTSEPVDRFPTLDAQGHVVFNAQEGARELHEAGAKRFIPADRNGGVSRHLRKAERQVERMLRHQKQRRRGALAQAETQQQDSGLGSRWRSLGPHDLGGRTHGIAIDPRNPKVMYAGAIAGGVWKSEDAGETWRPLADTAANVSVSSIALDPNNPDVIYAGTGDTIDQAARTGSRGAGIMVTRDAGANWSFLPSTQTQDFLFMNTLRVSPDKPGRLFAATWTGLLISDDGGQTWQHSYRSNEPMGCTDIDISGPAGNETILMSCGGVRDSEGVFHSGDGGRTWTQTIGKVNQQPAGRSSVAFAPSDPSVAYASVSNIDGVAIALLRSDRAGAPGSWTITTQPYQGTTPQWFGWCVMPQESKTAGQGWYDNVLEVDPTNANRLFIGGVDIFRSDDGGRTMYPVSYWWLDQEIGWDNIAGTQFNHADQHWFMFHPDYNGTTNQQFFTGNDGGIFRTDNATAPATDPRCDLTGNEVTWTPLNNGYSTSLFREGVVAPNGFVAGGLQDNGTWVDPEITEGRNTWTNAAGGDGGWTALDPDGAAVYATYPNGAVAKIVNGVEQPATRGLDLGQGLFVTPLVMDETNPQVLWIGLRRMFRTTDSAATWEPVSQPLGAPVETIAVSPANGELVLAATSDGQLFRTTAGYDPLPVWEAVGAGLPQETISAIGFDPTNDQNVYLTIGSFRDVGTVFKSTDGGVTWNNIDGSGQRSIPDTAAYAVAVDPTNPRRVYVGTDTGIFESLDGGGTWSVASQALTRTTVEDLTFRPGTSQLFAFTYGRGVYAADVGG